MTDDFRPTRRQRAKRTSVKRKSRSSLVSSEVRCLLILLVFFPITNCTLESLGYEYISHPWHLLDAVTPGEIPFQAILGSQTEDGRLAIVCGGALISRTWILTAAHCLQDHTTRTLYVVLGEHDIARNQQEEQWFKIRAAILHEKFDRDTGVNDVALALLDGMAQFNDFVRPVNLPRSADTAAVGNATVSGWSYRDNEGNSESTPLIMALPILRDYECKLLYTALAPSQLCAGFLDPDFNHEVFLAEPGAPLVCLERDPRLSYSYGVADSPMPPIAVNHHVLGRETEKQKKKKTRSGPGNKQQMGHALKVAKDADLRPYICGIVSQKGGGFIPGFPRLYTRVSHHLEWIENAILRFIKQTKTDSAKVAGVSGKTNQSANNYNDSIQGGDKGNKQSGKSTKTQSSKNKAARHASTESALIVRAIPSSNAYPFMGIVSRTFINQSAMENISCVGILLRENLVLTAEDCMYPLSAFKNTYWVGFSKMAPGDKMAQSIPAVEKFLFDPEKFFSRHLANSAKEILHPRHQRRNTILHTRHKNGAVVLQLSWGVTYSPFAFPATLPRTTDLVGLKATFVSLTEGGSGPGDSHADLVLGEYEIVTRHECPPELFVSQGIEPSEDVACAKFLSGSKCEDLLPGTAVVCRGDGTSPARAAGTSFLCGVVTFVPGRQHLASLHPWFARLITGDNLLDDFCTFKVIWIKELLITGEQRWPSYTLAAVGNPVVELSSKLEYEVVQPLLQAANDGGNASAKHALEEESLPDLVEN